MNNPRIKFLSLKLNVRSRNTRIEAVVCMQGITTDISQGTCGSDRGGVVGMKRGNLGGLALIKTKRISQQENVIVL